MSRVHGDGRLRPTTGFRRATIASWPLPLRSAARPCACRSGSNASAAQHATAWAPPIDVYETDDRYVITAEVPGYARADRLACTTDRLTICGHAARAPTAPCEHYHQVERGHGSFRADFQLPHAGRRRRHHRRPARRRAHGDPARNAPAPRRAASTSLIDGSDASLLPSCCSCLRLRRRHGPDRPVADGRRGAARRTASRADRPPRRLRHARRRPLPDFSPRRRADDSER